MAQLTLVRIQPHPLVDGQPELLEQGVLEHGDASLPRGSYAFVEVAHEEPQVVKKGVGYTLVHPLPCKKNGEFMTALTLNGVPFEIDLTERAQTSMFYGSYEPNEVAFLR